MNISSFSCEQSLKVTQVNHNTILSVLLFVKPFLFLPDKWVSSPSLPNCQCHVLWFIFGSENCAFVCGIAGQGSHWWLLPFCMSIILKHYWQGMDGSARKPALKQDTDYIVEKTYHIAPYLGAFGAYLMPQWPIYGSKSNSIYQNDRWKVAVNSHYLPSGLKAFSFGKKRP